MTKKKVCKNVADDNVRRWQLTGVLRAYDEKAFGPRYRKEEE